MTVRTPLLLMICGSLLIGMGVVACGPPPCLNNQECPVTHSCDVARKVCNSPDQPCREGAQRVCYEGAAGTRQLGTCRDGLETCNAGQWGPCEGQIQPAAEACDGLDHNCDGKVDQVGCSACTDGAKRTCYPGTTGCTRRADGSYDCKGICAVGQEVCAGGKWGACVGQVTPATTEICGDKLDNNCDGQIDENCNACELTGIFDTYLQDLFTGLPRTSVVIRYMSAAGYFQGNLTLTSKSHQFSVERATFSKTRAEFIIVGVESPTELELTLTGDMLLAGKPTPCPFSYTFKKKICDDFTSCARCSSDQECAFLYACQSGFCQNVKCSGNESVICEHACVDVQTNAQHCGECGNACPGGQVCKGAVCQ